MVMAQLYEILGKWQALVDNKSFTMMWTRCLYHDDRRHPVGFVQTSAGKLSKRDDEEQDSDDDADDQINLNAALAKHTEKMGVPHVQDDVEGDGDKASSSEEEEEEEEEVPAKKDRPRRSTASKKVIIQDGEESSNGEDDDYEASEEEATLPPPPPAHPSMPVYRKLPSKKSKNKKAPTAPLSRSNATTDQPSAKKKKDSKGKGKAVAPRSPSPEAPPPRKEPFVPVPVLVQSLRGESIQFAKLVDLVSRISVSPFLVCRNQNG